MMTGYVTCVAFERGGWICSSAHGTDRSSKEGQVAEFGVGVRMVQVDGESAGGGNGR